MKDKHDLVRGWLATDYAVAVRYDFEFWPDQMLAAAAVALAEQVQRIILEALPAACHPT
jgi:hypothetical protein